MWKTDEGAVSNGFCSTLHALNAENYPLVVYTFLIRYENLSKNIISSLPVLLETGMKSHTRVMKTLKKIEKILSVLVQTLNYLL